MRRFEKITDIRNKLASGLPSIGSWIQIPHPSIAEIIGDSGFDWTALDFEHGSISLHQVPDLCRALELGNTLPLARVGSHDLIECRRALDAGVGGIIVPSVEEKEALEKISDVCRWPPAGARGVGFARANLFGARFKEYQVEAQNPLLVAQIETKRGVQNLDAILNVHGLDAVFIGPYDLSASLGVPGDFGHSLFVQAIETVLDSCSTSGVAAGIHIIEPNPAEFEARVAEGYKFIAYSLDSVMLRSSCVRPDL